MHRNRILYAIPLSLVMSGEVFAADQNVLPEPPRSGTKKISTAGPQTKTVEKLEVHARRASTLASSATKSDTPLIATAQSVTVITRNEMDIRNVLNLNQAVRYTAGITADLRGGGVGTRYDQFALRGFTVPTFLDGLKLQDSPTGYAVAQTDTSRLDRIEILKGPASALYGQSSPGGLVALSSKLATDQRSYGSVNATGGMFDLYRVDADVGGYVTDNGFVRYRLNGTINGQHSQLARTGSRRFSISPSFTFGGDGPTTLTILGNYQYDPENGTYGGVPLVGSLKPASFGYLPRNFYDGDSSFEKYNRRHGSVTYIFNHRFNSDWSFSTRGRYDDIKTQYRSVYDSGYYVSDDTLARSAIATNEHTHNLAFDSQFKGKVRTGPLRHTMMFGFDYMQQSASEVGYYGSAPSLNVFHPNSQMVIPTPSPWVNYNTDSHQAGIYGQDEIHWRHLILTGSIRNDWYRSHQVDNMYNTTTNQSPSQITWRASGLYHFDFGLAPYISYSTSFQPQSGSVSTDGGKTVRQANPSLGKQLEGGLKYQLPGTSLLLTAAGFHIEQTNVLVAVGNTGYSAESGLVHSDGFEFEAHAEPFHNLVLTAAVSIQKVHDDSTGKPLIQSGKGNASLFAFYTMPSGPAKGLGFGGGMRYSNKSYGGEASYGSVWVPQYAVFDASIRYDLSNLSHSLHGWNVGASVRNLFDKNFIANCLSYASYGQEFCYYGERRNAQANIGFNW
ncbi:TonB-dependent siderophore receptor [Gluconobacter sphaericus]|uniref:Ligand-gated channel n=1 Tax=Gluconobacter sphaericus NBRC 12467 TaxID=1307951 RepID=A0AA37WDJ1_9PROT|nr:TonB-dependent siderophore receptor [Gluconobacter sphaericus]MBF0886421.1 TonB-dependent siderophore receptor [Gluconobacter sphaericus]GBR51795.1 TonB-dependent receptor [Gluconobacter sphaericus NBRC 12467]GEB43228.1 ligand-gated channel [Gluconobacter sphaericus NBRC 12467]GLQ86139.1 ligand-gated channel [Gluconobacter sphaericus NBRC 12467]